jgi:lysyl-tRNA synthetase class I
MNRLVTCRNDFVTTNAARKVEKLTDQYLEVIGAAMSENYLPLNFKCPTCGAAPQEKCKLNDDSPHF